MTITLFQKQKVVSKYKGNGKDAPMHARRHTGRVKEQLYSYLTSELDECEWPISCIGQFYPQIAVSTIHTCGWVGQRNSLNSMEQGKLSCGLS
jgi:hypothetical protein